MQNVKRGIVSLLTGATLLSTGFITGNTPFINQTYAAETSIECSTVNKENLYEITNYCSSLNKQSSEITNYIKGLKYNNDTVISKDTRTQVDKKADGKLNADDTFTIVRKEIENVHEDNADLGTLCANIQNIYPGSILLGNSNLANGAPTPLVTTDRASIKLTLDLNGAGEIGSKTIENPDYGNVKTAIDEIVQKWSEKKYKTTATIKSREVMAHSEEQLETELGVNGLDKKLNIDFSAINKGEKQVMIMEYKQIYFNARVNMTKEIFGEETTLDEIKDQVNDDNPPVMVTNVSYGRTIYVMFETTSKETDVEEAFKAKIAGTDISENAKYKKILDNTLFSAYVLGGTAGTGTKIATTKDFNVINDLINSEAEFGGAEQSAVYPISYATTFLKDNAQASVNSTTEYVKVTSEICNKTHVKLHQRGAYVVKKWYVDAQEIKGFDEEGNMILGEWKRFYSDTGVCVGKNVEFDIPGNYTNYKFAFDIKWGSDWPFKGIISKNNVKNIEIKVGGTCRNASYKIEYDDNVRKG